LVIIADELMPRRLWKLGRIIDAKMSNDGMVRQATIQTQKGIVKRPTSKLCPLECLRE